MLLTLFWLVYVTLISSNQKLFVTNIRCKLEKHKQKLKITEKQEVKKSLKNSDTIRVKF
jgi:hypothetical protein